jgi:hypothetical protein
MYGTHVALNYTVQLATVMPATQQGRLDPVRSFDHTPHSLFGTWMHWAASIWGLPHFSASLTLDRDGSWV